MKRKEEEIVREKRRVCRMKDLVEVSRWCTLHLGRVESEDRSGRSIRQWCEKYSGSQYQENGQILSSWFPCTFSFRNEISMPNTGICSTVSCHPLPSSTRHQPENPSNPTLTINWGLNRWYSSISLLIDLFFDSDEELLIKDDERKSLFDEFDSPTKTNQREKKVHIQKVSLFHETLQSNSLRSFEDLLLYTYPFSNLSIHWWSSEDEVCRSTASRRLGLSSSTGEYLFPLSWRSPV